MSTTKTYSVKVLNKTWEIKCPDHETANLQLAADKLNEQLQKNKKKFRQLDDFQNLLLAALHVSHELISCQNLQEQQRHQVSQFISTFDRKNFSAGSLNSLDDLQTD